MIAATTRYKHSERAFLILSALLFAMSCVATIALCRSMSDTRAMPMPGGWTMSMAWMVMPGQSLAGAAAAFLGMWIVMMAAMMLPSLVPMLLRYRGAVGARGVRLDWLATVVGIGYFAVWTALGILVFGVGFALSAAEMRNSGLSQAVPIGVGLLVLGVGALQFTAWKARRLACCSEMPASKRVSPANSATAWRHGLHLGLRCGYCCFGLMLIVIVLGVMDLRLMAIVTAAITTERLAPNGPQAARAIGGLVVAAGLFLIAHAAGVG